MKDVETFINDVILKLNIDKNELKTSRFSVSEVTRYDYEKKKHFKDGFLYSQTATLQIDYDMKKVGYFMEEVSKLSNPPTCRMNFELKNEESAKSLVIAKAYAKAEEKAKMIALAAGKKLKTCIKVDFRPFEERVISNSNLNALYDESFAMHKERGLTAETIQNIFVPEDITVSETLYCLWLAE